MKSYTVYDYICILKQFCFSGMPLFFSFFLFLPSLPPWLLPSIPSFFPHLFFCFTHLDFPSLLLQAGYCLWLCIVWRMVLSPTQACWGTMCTWFPRTVCKRGEGKMYPLVPQWSSVVEFASWVINLHISSKYVQECCIDSSHWSIR